MCICAGHARCSVEVMRPFHNETSGMSPSATGVEVRVPGWGATHTVEYIDLFLTIQVIHKSGTYAQLLFSAMYLT